MPKPKTTNIPLNFNQLKALQNSETPVPVATPIFSGNYKYEDGLNTPELAQIPVNSTADLQKLKLGVPKKMEQKNGLTKSILHNYEKPIQVFLQTHPNSQLFWTSCHIQDIHAKINEPQFAYWQKNKPQWENFQKRGNKMKDLTGEICSDVVAKNKQFITVSNLTDAFGAANKIDWDFASQLFANNACGAVFLLTSAQDEQSCGQTWRDVEYQSLLKNPNVDVIVELDLCDPEKVNSIIFTRGKVKDVCAKYNIPFNFYPMPTPFKAKYNAGKVECTPIILQDEIAKKPPIKPLQKVK